MKIITTISLATLLLSSAKSQTNVSGGIFSDATWTTANSPYIVTDTVVVFPGVVLTIEPGVTVKFENNQLLEIRQAQLIANGTAADSITFTSSDLFPTPGIFAGITLNGGSMRSQFKYCNLSYSLNGIVNSTSAYGFIIKHCKITFNVDGIRGGGLGNNSVLDSCIVENNIGTGATQFDTIKYCSISKNYRGVMDGFNIMNCVIDLNTEKGIYENTGSILNCLIRNNGTGIHKGNPLIIDNCIIKYNQTGIETSSNQSITNCVIDSNSIGIDNGSFIDAGHNYIALCEIKYDSIGILDYGSNGHGSNTFTNNIISSNSIGILLAVDVDSFYCNSICNNSLFGLKYDLPSNTNCVAGNYWCTADSASTQTVVYDAHDDVTLGIVNFMPLDSACSPLVPSVKETSQKNVLYIFPNPASDYLTIELTTTISKADINIFNLLGELMTYIHSANLKSNLDISNLSNGVYILEVIDGKNISRQKFIKQPNTR